MSEAETGKHYIVSGIYERDRHLLEFLDARGIRPGVRVDLVERNYDQTMSVRTTTGPATLGHLATGRIWLARAR
jgi:FeoA-like protein